MSARMVTVGLVLVTLLGWSVAPAQTPPAPAKDAAPAKPAAPAPAPKPKAIPAKSFGSAEEAVEALVTAVRTHDTKALIAVFGSEARPVILSGDPVSDRKTREDFVQGYDAAHKLVAGKAGGMTLQIGNDDWPLPIPIVKQGERWRFDIKQGREEILARRIGRNELNTMQVCLAYVDAQREYYSADRSGQGVLAYAQKFVSAPGKHDGLYWTTKAGEPQSPLGEFVARARGEGYRRDQSGGPTPYHGYLFRILTSQGPDAAGGAFQYIVRGYMMGGFALVAFPAQYGVSGVMTFIVNHDGIVYEKDLGPSTAATAGAMRIFNPDKTWAKADVTD